MKKQNFLEKKAIVIPKRIISELKKNKLTSSLMVTDIGYYSKANNHYRARSNGCEQYILIYCIDGTGWVHIDNHKRQILRPNQYVIISANTPHKYGSNQLDPWCIYWIHFVGDKADLLINHPNEILEINLSSNSRFTDRILLFEEIYYNLEMGYHLDNLEYANLCMWHMLGSFRYLSQFRKVKELHQSDKIQNSIKFMKSKLDHKHTLKELAAQSNLSISQYCLLFKKKTSQTPLNYLTFIRIQKACQFLDFSDLRISEIASKVGYSDPFYFSRVFTRAMEKSPHRYRNTIKG